MVLSVGSLFSGIGGIDLGLERAGFTITWQCERDEWCRKLLSKHWPEVPKYDDVQTLNPATVEPVDLLAGGFPCQDLSVAGKQAGLREGTRSGLWLEFARLIRALQPRYVLVENVPSLLTNHGLGRVLGDLAECGYDAEWQVLSAAAFGAPHLRKRVWIVAYAESVSLEKPALVFPESLQGKARGMGGVQQSRNCWETHQPRLDRVADGVPTELDETTMRFGYEDSNNKDEISSVAKDGVHRLKGLGNAVVPQIVEWIGERILTHANL